MTLYTCDGFEPVVRDGADIRSIDDAARHFANVAAQRKYGPSGYCHTVMQQASPRDLRYAHYEAYIGVREGNSDERKTRGRQIRITVSSQ